VAPVIPPPPGNPLWTLGPVCPARPIRPSVPRSPGRSHRSPSTGPLTCPPHRVVPPVSSPPVPQKHPEWGSRTRRIRLLPAPTRWEPELRTPSRWAAPPAVRTGASWASSPVTPIHCPIWTLETAGGTAARPEVARPRSRQRPTAPFPAALARAAERPEAGPRAEPRRGAEEPSPVAPATVAAGVATVGVGGQVRPAGGQPEAGPEAPAAARKAQHLAGRPEAAPAEPGQAEQLAAARKEQRTVDRRAAAQPVVSAPRVADGRPAAGVYQRQQRNLPIQAAPASSIPRRKTLLPTAVAERSRRAPIRSDAADSRHPATQNRTTQNPTPQHPAEQTT
jgi:hypothetical protein